MTLFPKPTSAILALSCVFLLAMTYFSWWLPQIIVFNRVRSMTSDMSLLVAAMRRSNELELLEKVKITGYMIFITNDLCGLVDTSPSPF